MITIFRPSRPFLCGVKGFFFSRRCLRRVSTVVKTAVSERRAPTQQYGPESGRAEPKESETVIVFEVASALVCVRAAGVQGTYTGLYVMVKLFTR